MDLGRSLKRDREPPRLSDLEWSLVKPILLSPAHRGGRSPVDRRGYTEGMLWVASTRRPWADMPSRYGKPDSVRRYYLRLRKSGTLERLLTTFPRSTTKDDPVSKARVVAGLLLECLRDLADRRPRGRAAHESRRE